MRLSFRDLDYDDFYTIDFVWVPSWHAWLTKYGHFEMVVITKPESDYPADLQAHLHPGDRICVSEGKEPTSLERAKSFALHWLRGFSIYRRTGKFPNDGATVNVS